MKSELLFNTLSAILRFTMSDEKRGPGRPLKIQDPTLLDEKILKWKTQREGKNLPLTMTSLAVLLDCDVDTLTRYQGREDFADRIKRAKQFCEAYAEDQLFIGKNPAGAIFNLCNNYKERWQNKQYREEKQEHSGTLEVHVHKD